MERKALTVRLDLETHQALEFIAEQTGESMNALINKAVAYEISRASERLERDLQGTLEKLRRLSPSLKRDAEEFARLESEAEEDAAEGRIVDMTADEVRAAKRESTRAKAGRRPKDSKDGRS